jgi:hypothetical protein
MIQRTYRVTGERISLLSKTQRVEAGGNKIGILRQNDVTAATIRSAQQQRSDDAQRYP